MKTLTDASIFEFPVTELSSWETPESLEDLVSSVRRALRDERPITMRAGGTSLGGQAIGQGVILDVSKYLTHVLDYRPEQREVVVEPGVIQEDLNRLVSADGLRFAPDTSTANRAMIGGMIGNNSCGAYSVFYGTTREHIKSAEVILADGSETVFEPLNPQQLHEKLSLPSLEGEIYRTVISLLEQHGEVIVEAFPDPSIIRRNTGYALDVLYREHQPFNPEGKPFSLVPLLCGSEGTLAIVKRATLNLVPLPKFRQLLCPHFDSVFAALSVVPDALSFHPAAIELIDKATLDGTKHNREQQQNRFWIEGDPEAVLVVELFADSQAELDERVQAMQTWFSEQGAITCPVIPTDALAKVWAVRKAGLGLLMGKPSRKKAVAVVEDGAVPVAALPQFFAEVQALMQDLQVGCVYYGHASVGLIHVRPELDLADQNDRQKMVQIARRYAHLIKKYRGAISGEHGDGRIRASFLPELLGEEVYGVLQQLKQAFDPKGLLNPGVIIGKMPINSYLRAYRRPVDNFEELVSPAFDWSADLSLMDAVEKCNGAGACRKSTGVMCPSYQATREEAFSTRGRSNLLRYALTEPDPRQALKDDELQAALDLCLGCKGCKTECPASVDMARLKSEVLYQVKQAFPRFSLQDWAVAKYGRLMQWGSRWPAVFNFVQNLAVVKSLLQVDERRPLPKLAKQSAQAVWAAQSQEKPQTVELLVLVDLYSNYQEPEVALSTFDVLQKLGVRFQPIFMVDSPRALISQGLLKEAKAALMRLAKQVDTVVEQTGESVQVLGLEPSEISVWMDELPDLFPEIKNSVNKSKKSQNSQSCLPFSFSGLGILTKIQPFEDFLLQFSSKNPAFTWPQIDEAWLHVHCHQKALMSPKQTESALKLVAKSVKVIESGCCGMSGAFGYQHYAVSKKIAEQAVLPAVAEMPESAVLVATGTSCRHQVADLSKHSALHLTQVFALAFKKVA